jgi:hypothetical protein
MTKRDTSVKLLSGNASGPQRIQPEAYHCTLKPEERTETSTLPQAPLELFSVSNGRFWKNNQGISLRRIKMYKIIYISYSLQKILGLYRM